MCGHKHKKSPETAFAERVIFLLVEAPPQSPANTKCVLERSPSDRGYAIFQIADDYEKCLSPLMGNRHFVFHFLC